MVGMYHNSPHSHDRGPYALQPLPPVKKPAATHHNEHAQPPHIPEQRSHHQQHQYPEHLSSHTGHGGPSRGAYGPKAPMSMTPPIAHPHPHYGTHTTATRPPEGTGHATPANVNPHVLRHGGDAIDHARTHGDEGDREPEKKSLLRRIWDTLERNNPYAGGASKKKKKEEEHLREGSHLQVSGPSGPPLGGGGGRGNSRNGLDGIPSHTHVGSGSGPGPGPQYYGNGGGGVNGGGGDAGGGCNCDCNCQ